MTLNLDTLPSMISLSLLARARKEGRSIHEVAAAALAEGLGISDELPESEDVELDWAESPAFGKALEEFALLDAIPA